MAIITDAISSLMGGSSENWRDKLRPASFRGVPFGVITEDTTHGRRVAVHDYPYRDTAWVEDMGRGLRKITMRCFIVENSQVYGGGDVILQRRSLIDACEKNGSGTLIHPTLGELTVSVPEGGLRVSGSMDNGRAFEFSLTVFESGLKVFAVTSSEVASAKVSTNYFKLVTTTVLGTIARIKGEIRSVTQAIKTVKGIIAFWTNIVDSTLSEVTNVSNTLKSTFGNTRYGRYSGGVTGGSSNVNRSASSADVDDPSALTRQTLAQSVMERKKISDSITALNVTNDIDSAIHQISDVVQLILNSTGGVNDRLRNLEKLALAQSEAYQQAIADKAVAESINALILVLCSAAMAVVATSANPASRDESIAITEQVCEQLEQALLRTGDRGDDDIYQSLLILRESFITSMSGVTQNLADLIDYQTPASLPALTLANRLYQDVGRAEELIHGTRVPHPAFMPTSLKVLRK